MECPHCGSKELKVYTNIRVSMPIEYLGRITKRKLRDNKVKIYGVENPNTHFVCGRCNVLLNSPVEIG